MSWRLKKKGGGGVLSTAVTAQPKKGGLTCRHGYESKKGGLVVTYKRTL